jgi:deoxyribodipyrimidine photo-lyase
MTTGLFCFTHDLRLQDNPALSKASMSVDKLICSYNFTPAWCQHSRSVSLKLGDKRQAFLDQSVADLANSLTELGQKLIITKGDPFISISELIERYQPSDVFYSEQIAFFERATWQALACAYPQCQFHLLSSYTLFDEN